MRLSGLDESSSVENPRTPPLKSLDVSPTKLILRSKVKRPISIVAPIEQKSGNGLSALAPPFVPAREYPIMWATRD